MKPFLQNSTWYARLAPASKNHIPFRAGRIGLEWATAGNGDRRSGVSAFINSMGANLLRKQQDGLLAQDCWSILCRFPLRRSSFVVPRSPIRRYAVTPIRVLRGLDLLNSVFRLWCCTLALSRRTLGAMVNLIIPDKWQQDAVNLLREGRDVVVQAPTGAGKTYIFELLYESLRGQAIYTVPTRALANDKLAEWRARGWDVGISTGDVSENLSARVVVATLETQKARFLRGDGPRLLVVDEYQLLTDPTRGTNYELILALAPSECQILLLSGSVANPQDVAAWLKRLGRKVELVMHPDRPVRLEEIMLNDIPLQAPASIRDYWPRMIARALMADLGPLLIFAPRRNSAEELAQALLAMPAFDESLAISQEQAMIAGEPLAKLLRHRIAYHHSGLSYAVRAGIIEPLAKRGQLRIVVATMGLAAGINFSMRSVLITGTHYMAGNIQKHVRPDELLQMFGRAGRRGLDETGYALVTPDIPRLHEAFPLKLKRSEPLDWPSFIAVMNEASLRGEDPFRNAVDLSRRLFTTKTLSLGIERYYESAYRPCEIRVDAERGRFVRRHQVEMKNSMGHWQKQPPLAHTTLSKLWLQTRQDHWRPALMVPASLNGIGFGTLCKCRLGNGAFEYGREVPVAVVSENGWTPVKWLRKHLRERYPLIGQRKCRPEVEFERELLPIVEAELDGKFWNLVRREYLVSARFRFGHKSATGYLDEFGRFLADPLTRQDYPEICRACAFRPECESTELAVTAAFAWRQLGLIDKTGKPIRRGVLFSFFNHGEGLAIAAALEQDEYLIEDLVFDLANLRAGHRFALDESPFGGRLGLVCQKMYNRGDYPGYLEMGVPPAYGAGASEVIRAIVEEQTARHRFVNDALRHGDIERAITEWKSLLRQIVNAPDYDWNRWRALKNAAARYGTSTRSAAQQPLPLLLPAQMKRYHPSAQISSGGRRLRFARS
jgi:superfamily II DNA/RNA helicase